MRRTGFALAMAIAVAAVGLPALADEIIYFTNGTSMPVVSHEVDGDTIRVVLNGSSLMAFPLEQVDRVEDARGKVVSSRSGYNQAVSGVPDVGGGGQSATAPGRFRRQEMEEQPQEQAAAPDNRDARGMAVSRPFGNSEQANKRKIATTGSRSIFNQGPITNRSQGLVGTKRVGNNNVIPRGTGVTRPAPVGITQRTN